jgi:hypothetical protein
MKNDEFHKPFIKNLAFVGLVTIVSMISVHYFFQNMYLQPSNTPEYTSQKFHISTEPASE